MANDFIKGDVIILSVYDDTDMAYRPIACLTSNSLNRTKNIIETQTKCDPGIIQKQAGTQTYELPFEGNYIDTTSVGAEVTKASHDYLMNIMDGDANTVWRMSTGLTDTPFYYGTAILNDLSNTNPSESNFSTFSGNFSGIGLILRDDPK